MKPVDYGLSSQQLTDVAERNLKILATTMLYLVRRVSGSRGRSMMVENIISLLSSDSKFKSFLFRDNFSGLKIYKNGRCVKIV